MTLNPQILKAIKADIEAVLPEIAKKHGVSLHVKQGGTYYADHATLKVELATIGENGELHTAEATAFKSYCYGYGLKPEDLGKKFTVRPNTAGATVYTIVGLKPKAYKMPILCQANDGKTYKFAASTVQFWLAFAEKKDEGKPNLIQKPFPQVPTDAEITEAIEGK